MCVSDVVWVGSEQVGECVVGSHLHRTVVVRSHEQQLTRRLAALEDRGTYDIQDGPV